VAGNLVTTHNNASTSLLGDLLPPSLTATLPSDPVFYITEPALPDNRPPVLLQPDHTPPRTAPTSTKSSEPAIVRPSIFGQQQAKPSSSSALSTSTPKRPPLRIHLISPSQPLGRALQGVTVLEFPRISITDRAELDRRIRMLQVVVSALPPSEKPPVAGQSDSNGSEGIILRSDGGGTANMAMVEKGKRTRQREEDEKQKRPRSEGPLVDYGSDQEGEDRAGDERIRT
jgi:hypothetical protein